MTKKKPEDIGKSVAKKAMTSQNKRRKELGVEIHNFDSDPDDFFSSSDSRYIRDLATRPGVDMSRFFVGGSHFERSDRMNLLRRAKLFLFRRSFADLSVDSVPKLYGAKNDIETVLDCFPSLKYSYSSSLPLKVVMRNHGIPEDFYGRFKPNGVRYFDVCCAPDGSSKKARMTDVSRSASIRLDPMDAPRQLFIYRCRIRRCLAWGYSVGLVPIMMTLTIFHRWNPLKKLLNVLSQSWDRFWASGRPAVTRTKKMGVQAYIRRLEETFTNGSDSRGYNSGWHPHYHVILFVPSDKVSEISDMESELQSDWFDIVNHFFEKEFGEGIDSSYAKAFKRHGLVFSRYKITDLGALSSSSPYRQNFMLKNWKGRKLPIRPVDDSEYMAKTVGCDPRMFYSGDTELTSIHAKNSRIPFDLLCDDTAENNDLWVEYALATKGLRSFVFSRGLGGRVRDYFEAHPERDTVKSFVKSDKVVAQIDSDVYGLLYRTCQVDEMLRVAVKGYDALCDWFRIFYQRIGYSVDEIGDDMMPLPPNTCLPFGDRVDILTFSQRSKLKTKPQSKSASSTSSPSASDETPPTSVSGMNGSEASSVLRQQSSITEAENLSIKPTTISTRKKFTSKSSTRPHPVQLELQFYPSTPKPNLTQVALTTTLTSVLETTDGEVLYGPRRESLSITEAENLSIKPTTQSTTSVTQSSNVPCASTAIDYAPDS